MTITFSLIAIPIILSIIILLLMFRPVPSSNWISFAEVFRILWLVPLSIIWMVYALIIAYWK